MTPMAESLWWVMQQMCLLRENRKIILIITDGEPDSIPAAQVIKKCQELWGGSIPGGLELAPGVSAYLGNATEQEVKDYVLSHMPMH